MKLNAREICKGSITGNYSDVHTLVLTPDINYEDLFAPEAWVDFLQRGIVKIHDEIIVWAHDNSYRAHLVVLATSRRDEVAQWAKVRELIRWDFTENMKPETVEGALGKYDIRVMGRKGWCIIRLEDGAELGSNLGSRAKAEEMLKEFLAANEPAQSV